MSKGKIPAQAAEKMSERDKVRALYKLIGDRGLYVNTNFDVFTEKPEMAPCGTNYTLPLISPGQMAFASPMLFTTLTSLLNHGTMILTGGHGIGKTTGAEFAGHFFTGTPLDDILEAEIQGHPQQTEEKMVASLKLNKLLAPPYTKEILHSKFMDCPVRILDEVRRCPPDILNIVMRVVDTGKAVYQGETVQGPPGPLWVTANYTDEGSFELTPPFLDRFDVAVMVTSPPSWDLKKIRERGDWKLNGELAELLKIPEGLKLDFESIRRQIYNMPEEVDEKTGVPLVSAFADFIYSELRFSGTASRAVCRATKGNIMEPQFAHAPATHFQDDPWAYTTNELSVRTSFAMQRYAKAFAWFTGKDRVTLNELKMVAPYLLWHKVQPSQKATGEQQVWANDRVDFAEALVQRIETGYQQMLSGSEVKYWVLPLKMMRTGKYKPSKEGPEVEATDAMIRDYTAKAIGKLGEVDHPWAINLAAHLSSRYNEWVMEKQEAQK